MIGPRVFQSALVLDHAVQYTQIRAVLGFQHRGIHLAPIGFRVRNNPAAWHFHGFKSVQNYITENIETSTHLPEWESMRDPALYEESGGGGKFFNKGFRTEAERLCFSFFYCLGPWSEPPNQQLRIRHHFSEGEEGREDYHEDLGTHNLPIAMVVDGWRNYGWSLAQCSNISFPRVQHAYPDLCPGQHSALCGDDDTLVQEGFGALQFRDL